MLVKASDLVVGDRVYWHYGAKNPYRTITDVRMDGERVLVDFKGGTSTWGTMATATVCVARY